MLSVRYAGKKGNRANKAPGLLRDDASRVWLITKMTGHKRISWGLPEMAYNVPKRGPYFLSCDGLKGSPQMAFKLSLK